jgi:hypothetical protein
MLFWLFYFVPPPAARNPQLGRLPRVAFKQRVPGISLSLEQGTEAVPDDHRYHLLHAGSEIASFKQEAQALRTYRAERDRLLAEARGPERAPPERAEIRRRLIGDAEYEAFRRGAAARK